MPGYFIARIAVRDPGLTRPTGPGDGNDGKVWRRYLVRGGETELREGSWRGRTVAIEFPDLATARAWYNSPEYQAILPFRLVASQGDAILVEGVD